jgi:hypothetical protein
VFTSRLEIAGIHVSWDGRGRALDNVFVERLWRSVKWEEVYLHAYETVADAVQGLRRYFRFYNEERLHQALGYRTPASVYVARGGWIMRRDRFGRSPLGLGHIVVLAHRGDIMGRQPSPEYLHPRAAGGRIATGRGRCQ